MSDAPWTTELPLLHALLAEAREAVRRVDAGIAAVARALRELDDTRSEVAEVLARAEEVLSEGDTHLARRMFRSPRPDATGVATATRTDGTPLNAE
jgi:hypothetical protein